MRERAIRMHRTKAWGQNFLVNQGAADSIVIAFRAAPSDLVLEVGPGRGVLTRRLAGRVARLLAVEIDPVLADELRADLAGTDSVTILRSDILVADLRSLLQDLGANPGRRARVISNLPYSSATAIILSLIRERDLIADLLVLVQREVADRIASPPGRKSYGGLSVLCQAAARVEPLLRLKPGSFRPIPKVESMLVRLTLRPGEADAPPEGGLEALLRIAFAQRRKTLLNNLTRLPGPRNAPIGTSEAAALIGRAGLDPRARPETIDVDGFRALLRELRAL